MHPKYRPDIDGLRCAAVLCVIVFHAWPLALPGGFIGVDVFFVISGYLIGALLLRELGTDSLNLAGFYLRRIRRLFPALAAVLLATWVMGWFLSLPNEFGALGKHILGGAGFAANIVTWNEVGYFDAPAATKPLLHLWSLGVEEQFYLMLPPLLFLAWRWRIIGPAIAALGIISLAFSLWQTTKAPEAAFFLPFSRIWEFMLGTGLAHAEHRGFKLRAAGLASLAGILVTLAAAVFTPHDGFPGWKAVFPVIGATLVIASGPTAIVNRALSFRPLVYLGLISYPLYLWHWPLLVFSPWPPEYSILAAVALSIATYELIEKPIRRIQFNRAVAGLCATMIAVGFLGFHTMTNDGMLGRYPSALQALVAPVNGYTFKKTSPGAGPLVVVFGDSHADHLSRGLEHLQTKLNFKFIQIRGFDAVCGPFNPPLTTNCSIQNRAFQDLEQARPDIVLISGFWFQYKRLHLLDGMIQRMKRLGVKHVAVAGTMPFWRDKATQKIMYEIFLKTGTVPTRLSQGYLETSTKADPEIKAIAHRNSAEFIDMFDFLCPQGVCVTRLGDTAADIVQFDSTHFTDKGSVFASRAFESWLATSIKQVSLHSADLRKSENPN